MAACMAALFKMFVCCLKCAIAPAASWPIPACTHCLTSTPPLSLAVQLRCMYNLRGAFQDIQQDLDPLAKGGCLEGQRQAVAWLMQHCKLVQARRKMSAPGAHVHPAAGCNIASGAPVHDPSLLIMIVLDYAALCCAAGAELREESALERELAAGRAPPKQVSEQACLRSTHHSPATLDPTPPLPPPPPPHISPLVSLCTAVCIVPPGFCCHSTSACMPPGPWPVPPWGSLCSAFLPHLLPAALPPPFLAPPHTTSLSLPCVASCPASSSSLCR